MKLRTHYVRSLQQRGLLNGPLRSLVLAQVPRNRLVTEELIFDGVVLYLDNHPGERLEMLRHIAFERVRPACEQLLAELVLDGFVIEIPGRELSRFVDGL